jgi:hypothetical protein
MRLAHVAMASVQASRFPSSPSTPAQAQPAAQARTGKLIFIQPKNSHINTKKIITHLGGGFRDVIRHFDQKDYDILVNLTEAFQKGKLQFHDITYQIVTRNTESPVLGSKKGPEVTLLKLIDIPRLSRKLNTGGANIWIEDLSPKSNGKSASTKKAASVKVLV